MKFNFLGASQTVTGSCHLITTAENRKILLDCGQFQGGRSIERLNYESFGFDPAEIDVMILSHAHIDHSGRIPLLVKQGFKGAIYCTDATYDLASIMLRDSGYIHEKEAEWENRKNTRAGKPLVEPLYTFDDAEKSLVYFKPVLYGQLVSILNNVKIRFSDAGHILGSSIVELWITEGEKTTKVVFSGDLGVKGRPILRDPEIIKEADVLIMETTYGNRLHEESSKSIESFVDIILRTTRRGGTVVIPAFAVGRTQELIYQLHRFYEENVEFQKELDNINVYIDSPLATSATEIFRRNAQVFDKETRDYILNGDNPLDFKNLRFTRSADESRALNFIEEPKIIISASGMCEAGRIKHHLKHNLWNPKSSIVFVGYQAEGTLGKRLKDGEKDVVLFGESIHVNAEIYALEGFSGHADQAGLLEWLRGFEKKPKKVFLVHGEEESKLDFAKLAERELGYHSIIVRDGSDYLIDDGMEVHHVEAAKPLEIEYAEIGRIKDKLYGLHSELEKILYNANLAVSDKLDAEHVEDIKSLLLELEKNIINLGAAVSLREKEQEA